MKKKFALIIVLVLTIVGCFAFCACSQGQIYKVNVAQTDNGTVFAVNPQAEEGEKVLLSCVPKAGYKLDCYQVNGKKIKGNTFVMPNSDVEISATFSVITYGITYIADGKIVETDNPTTYTAEDSFSLNPPQTKDGYEFAGWYLYFVENDWQLDELKDFAVSTVEKGNTGELTLYAHYYNVPHAVNLDENLLHGTVYAYCETVSDGESGVGMAGVDEEVYLNFWVEDFYKFVYFTVDGERIDGNSFIMPNHAVEVSAVIQPIEYQIVYNLDGGENSSENPFSYNVESESFELKAAVKDGHDFVGWYCFQTGSNVTNIEELKGYYDVTLLAMYEENVDY